MKVVGARIPRYDGIAHVTGRTTFVDDVRVPGTLWVKALRSPHHSRAITKLDTGPAEDMPGVHAVVTHADVPLNEYGHLSGLGIPADEPLLAVDEVRYKGQPIALVAADDGGARRGGGRRDRDRVRGAAGAHRRAQGLRRRRAQDPPRGATGTRTSRTRWTVARSARATSTGPSRTPTRSSRASTGRPRSSTLRSRPRSARSCPEPNGRLTIYSCTQALYFSMGVVAAHLQVPLNKLKFVGGTTGGGFGGKVDTATETMCSLLALKSGKPVKWRWTREEEFLCSSTRAPWHMEIADAVTKDGWILGRKMLTLHDAGAYARFSPYGLTKHSFHHTGRLHDPEPLRSTGTSCSRTACRRRRCAASASRRSRSRPRRT